MNEKKLELLENELVPVYTTDSGEKVVYGRELYEVLGVKSKFADWVKNRFLECDAVENTDYESFSKILENGGRTIEYIIALDTAKEMSMLERRNRDKAKVVIKYLDEVEKKYTKKHDELTLLENELVPVYTTDSGEKVVYGRELWEVLGSKQDFSTWMKKRIFECDVVENEDYTRFHKKMEANNATKIEYIIKLDIAKEMAMLEHNDKGKQVRRYFIEVEKRYKNEIATSKNELANINTNELAERISSLELGIGNLGQAIEKQNTAITELKEYFIKLATYIKKLHDKVMEACDKVKDVCTDIQDMRDTQKDVYTDIRDMRDKTRDLYVENNKMVRWIQDKVMLMVGIINTMTINTRQQNKILTAVRKRVAYLLGGAHSARYKKYSKVYFANCYIAIQEKFDIPSYRDLHPKDMKECLRFIKGWRYVHKGMTFHTV